MPTPPPTPEASLRYVWVERQRLADNRPAIAVKTPTGEPEFGDEVIIWGLSKLVQDVEMPGQPEFTRVYVVTNAPVTVTTSPKAERR